MEKSRIEKFAAEYNVEIELQISKDKTRVYISKGSDVYIYSYSDEYLSKAVEAATSAFKKREEFGE